MAKLKYTIEYGSNSQHTTIIMSTSRNAKKLGGKLLGKAGGGYVRVYLGEELISTAKYTPEGCKWYSTNID